MGTEADLQPVEGADLNHVAVSETVIQLNDERYWLYAVVDPATNRLLHVRFYSTRTQVLTEMLFAQLRGKHHVDMFFLVDGVSYCRQPAIVTASDASMKHIGTGMQSKVSSENSNDGPPLHKLFEPRPGGHCRKLAASARLRMEPAYLNTTWRRDRSSFVNASTAETALARVLWEISRFEGDFSEYL